MQATIDLACVGCHFIEDNIVNWKMDIDTQSLTLKKSPVPGIDETAIGVFLEDKRVGFIPRDDKARVLEFIQENKQEGMKKEIIITKVQASIDDPGIVIWFGFNITITT